MLVNELMVRSEVSRVNTWALNSRPGKSYGMYTLASRLDREGIVVSGSNMLYHTETELWAKRDKLRGWLGSRGPIQECLGLLG